MVVGDISSMDEKKSYFAVIIIQAIYAGMFLLSKAAFNGGMNCFVFVFYRQATATILLVPLALYFEWKKAPPLSLATFCKIFMLSLFGITISLDVNGVALVSTSATLAAATTNCLPVITFFLAVLFGMEVLRLRTVSGVAKMGGIIVCLGGAAILAFYKGPTFGLLPRHHLLHDRSQVQDLVALPSATWIKGCFLMLASNILWGLWLVLQGFVLKSYPSKLLFTTLLCLLSSIQSFAIAMALERNPYQWKLSWNLNLLAVAYCGLVVTGVTYYLQAWVIEKKGPVFIAMSTPLAFIITLFFSTILLGEVITLGSVLGGLLLIGGLYSVLWGKSREEEISSSTSSNVELHQEKKHCSDAKHTNNPSPLTLV